MEGTSSNSRPTFSAHTQHHGPIIFFLVDWLCRLVSRPILQYSSFELKHEARREKPSLVLSSSSSSSSSSYSKSLHMLRVFNFFDENGDGKISPSELRRCMKMLGQEMSDEEAVTAVGCTDSDGDGLLGFDDFMKIVEAEGEEDKGRNLREAFKVYEMEGEGCITPTSLSRTLGRLGEDRSVEECSQMIRRFDLNGDGVISFDEFKTMMLASSR